mgnify:CR=1 FL=1
METRNMLLRKAKAYREEQEQAPEETLWRGSVYVSGIKKRARKARRRISLDLGYLPLNVSDETIKAKAVEVVKASMRSLTHDDHFISLNYITRKGNIETWEPHSGKDRKLALEVEL